MAKSAPSSSRNENLATRARLERVRAKLLMERASFDRHYRELGQFIMPRRTRFLVDDENQDNNGRTNRIVDSTAGRAARTLRSGMHAGITSPARPWMKLTTPDPSLAQFGPVKSWLKTVTDRMLTVFAKSNLYNVLPTVYGDQGVFGTGAMAILDDEQELIRCYSYPVGSYALGVSRRQIVDTFVMDYKLTVRQIVDEFGVIEGTSEIDWSHISKAVRNQWDKGNTENSVTLVWMIAPNQEADPERLESKFKPWQSVHWELGGEAGVFLREKGFDEFPVMAPRWEVTGGDYYGTDCPGMICLGDIKALQIMQRRKAQLVEIGINPSLQGPSSLIGKKVSLKPGEMTYLDNLQLANQGVREIRKVDLNALRFFLADIQDTRTTINEGFFKDLFLMLASGDQQRMTAREVAERHEEKLLSLGPVLERENDELLDPTVDRTYAMMDRVGMIPPPPQELHGVKLKVEYVSIMAQAQKLVGVSGLSSFINSTVPLIQILPEVKHKLDGMAIVDEYADLYGVNPKLVIPDGDARKAMQVEAQQRAQAQKLAQTEQMSKAAKNLSGTDMSDDSVLSKVLQGAQQQQPGGGQQ